MLETLGFLHISSKNPVADIANRKHYSAPAGALTMYLPYQLVFEPPNFWERHQQ